MSNSLLDKKTEDLLKDLIKELKKLNESLEDFKIMIAPYLGFKVVKNKREEKKEV